MTRFLTNRGLHFGILFLILIAAVLSSGSELKFRKALENLVFDQYMRLNPRPDPEKVIIVDYDDVSLARISQWPWPRYKIAQLIDNLVALDAKVVAFDGVLAEKDRVSPQNIISDLPETEDWTSTRRQILTLPDYDDVLARSIRESGRFIAGFTYGHIEQEIAVKKPLLTKKQIKDVLLERAVPFDKTAAFLPELVKASQGNGSFMARPEDDGIIRQTGLIFTNRKNLYPSLSLEAVRLAVTDGKTPYKIWQDPDYKEYQDFTLPYRVVLGDYKIPVDENGLINVYFRSFSRDKDYVSAYKVMDPAYHDEIRPKIAGKIVFIGSSAEGLKDLRSSPLNLFIPGVEVHANVTEQILEGKYLYRSYINKIIEVSFIFIMGLAMILLAPFIGMGSLIFIAVLAISGLFYGSWWAYVTMGLLLDPVYASGAVMILTFVSSLFTYLRSEMERKQVREAFGLYVSPTFMEELAANPDKLKLGGEVKELTVMFTDIRSFTTISEALSPEQLIQLMNDFLTPMSDLVMSNRGTIDKYMGDAMMAFWNAPLDDPDHARHACQAALGMNKALYPINDQVKKQCEAEGRPFVPLNAGIGINTGPCSVGNMGSKQRFAYSALGDAVNLASRLEGQTKSYGVNILIGEDTAKYVQDFAWLELDLVQVKGKIEPARIYTLVGTERVAKKPAFKSWKAAHDELLEVYRAGDFAMAEEILLQVKEFATLDLVDYYVMMMTRIERFQKQHPGPDWNGVYVATSK
ncbi:MAG: adenylate/guanylate cyclase domain-containing protein [Rhodospirillales bacterium]|nr:adenylate/guanylate cyclase domain-containing protein [Rhodospirillales bacterium]